MYQLTCKKCSAIFAALLLVFTATGCFNEEVVLINLGDSLTNGVQSNGVNELTQMNGYTELLNRQLAAATDCTWSNPLLDLSGVRKDASVVPYNLGVSGATAKSLVEEKTNSTNPLLTQLLSPLPALAGKELTQLEAALYLAKENPDKKKVFTLWIGNNDVLGAVTNGSGSQLTVDAINAFLNDTSAGHDLETVKGSISTAIHRLASVPNSEVYVATLPYVTSTAYLFNETDIERMAAFADADLTTLAAGSSIGFGPFFNPADPANSVSRTLNPYSSNLYLNGAVQMLSQYDAYVLSADEAALINARITKINDFIKHFAKKNKNISIVDVNAKFSEIANGITFDERTLTRSFGGGLFSLDGVHPSNTSYGIIANLFIDAINARNHDKVEEVNLSEILDTDPYYDKDGDGYVSAPAEPLSIYSFLVQLADSNDYDATVIAPYINPMQLANLPLAVNDTIKTHGVTVCGNRVIFVYDDTINGVTTPATIIYIRGSFNGWTKVSTNMMTQSATSGVWFFETTTSAIAIPGNSGQPEFKFHVNGSWINIPATLEAGYRFQGNHIVVFPGDDTSVIAANEVQALTVKTLADFDLTTLAGKETIANFRSVAGMTGLYRSYHPYKISRPTYETEPYRLAIVNELLAYYGVQSVITVSGYEAPDASLGESVSAYLQNIVDNGHNYYTTTDYNSVYYYSNNAAFGTYINGIVSFILAPENNAPFMLHCRIGTDRTGVSCAVLAALCGLSWDQIAADYQKSNNTGISEFRDYKLLKYSFEHMLGVSINSSSDLKSLLSAYFIGNGYLTQEQIDALPAKLL